MIVLQSLDVVLGVEGAELLPSVLDFVVVLVSLLASFAESAFGSLTLEDDLRLSVAYQPLPLNTMAGGTNTRRAWPEHWGQICSEGASKPSCFS